MCSNTSVQLVPVMTGVVTALMCVPLICRFCHAAVPGMISSNSSGNEQLKPRSSDHSSQTPCCFLARININH